MSRITLSDPCSLISSPSLLLDLPGLRGGLLFTSLSCLCSLFTCISADSSKFVFFLCRLFVSYFVDPYSFELFIYFMLLRVAKVFVLQSITQGTFTLCITILFFCLSSQKLWYLSEKAFNLSFFNHGPFVLKIQTIYRRVKKYLVLSYFSKLSK